MDKLYLTEAQKASPLWFVIEQHMKARLEAHRKANDSAMNEADTQKLRGRIAEAKYVLELAADPPRLDAKT